MEGRQAPNWRWEKPTVAQAVLLKFETVIQLFCGLPGRFPHSTSTGSKVKVELLNSVSHGIIRIG